MKAHVFALCACVGLLVLAACGGGPQPGDAVPEPKAPQVLAPTQVVPATGISVLMMGNSHTRGNQLSKQLEDLLRAGFPDKSVAVVVAPGSMFLDERLADRQSMDLLRSREWTAVVLQAQKYSTTGMYSYSTTEAQTLVREARAVKALPVLFPEWPRRGEPETDTIYALHVSIARQQPACVAPVGQAWDLAQARMPTVSLHASDGNHSNAAGAYLSALMLFATIAGKSPLDLPPLANGVDAAIQEKLRSVAADAALLVAPRLYCPAG